VAEIDATLELESRLTRHFGFGWAGSVGRSTRDEAAQASASLLGYAEKRFLEEVDVELAHNGVLSDVE